MHDKMVKETEMNEDSEVSSLKQQLFQAGEFGKQLLEENAKLHDQIEELTQEAKSGWDRVEELNQEIHSAWGRVDELSAQLESVETEHRARQRSHLLQMEEMETRNESRGPSDAEWNKLIEQIKTLRNQLEEEKRRSSDLEIELTESHHEITLFRNQHVVPLTKENENLNEVLKNEKQKGQHLSEELMKAHQEIHSSKKVLQDLRQLYDAEQDKVKTLKHDLVEMQLELGALRKFSQSQNNNLLRTRSSSKNIFVQEEKCKDTSTELYDSPGNNRIQKLEFCLEQSNLQIQKIKALSEGLRQLICCPVQKT